MLHIPLQHTRLIQNFASLLFWKRKGEPHSLPDFDHNSTLRNLEFQWRLAAVCFSKSSFSATAGASLSLSLIRIKTNFARLYIYAFKWLIEMYFMFDWYILRVGKTSLMNQYPSAADLNQWQVVIFFLFIYSNFLGETLLLWNNYNAGAEFGCWLSLIQLKTDMWIGNSVISIKQQLGLISWPKRSNLRTGYLPCRSASTRFL